MSHAGTPETLTGGLMYSSSPISLRRGAALLHILMNTLEVCFQNVANDSYWRGRGTIVEKNRPNHGKIKTLFIIIHLTQTFFQKVWMFSQLLSHDRVSNILALV